MERCIVSLLLIGLCVEAAGQNLVPNGSFEEYTQCPDFWSQTERATGWSEFRNSPDYFHSCEPTGQWSVPHNVFGYQIAATGLAYCGMYTWCPGAPNGQEHFGAELLAPLVPGVPLDISFKYVNTTEGYENAGYAVTGFGVLFTMDPYYTTEQSVPLPGRAALFVESVSMDTMEWQFVSGTYTPDSAYRYVVIGGMFPDSLITIDTLNPVAVGNCGYAYIDDVCVTVAGSECLFTDAIQEGTGDGLHVYPNPCTDILHIAASTSLQAQQPLVTIRDIHGRSVVQNEPLRAIPAIVDLRELPLGPLLVSIGGVNGPLKEMLVIHVEP